MNDDFELISSMHGKYPVKLDLSWNIHTNLCINTLHVHTQIYIYIYIYIYIIYVYIYEEGMPKCVS